MSAESIPTIENTINEPSFSEQLAKRAKAPTKGILETISSNFSKTPAKPVVSENPISTEEMSKVLEETKTTSKTLEELEKREAPTEEKKPEEIKEAEAGDIDKDLETLENFGKEKEKETPIKKDKEYNFRQLEERKNAIEKEFLEYKKSVEPQLARIKELEEQLEKVSFEHSPKFQEKFIKPKEEAIKAATNFAKEIFEEEGEQIAAKALSLRGKERLDYIEEQFGSSTVAGAEFLRLVNEADSKRKTYEQAVNDYRKTRENLSLEETKEAIKTQEEILGNFQKTANALSSKISFLREVEGDVEHNNKVKERIEAAKAIVLGTASESDMQLAPFLAVIAKDALAELASARKELQKYKSRMAEESSSLSVRSSGNASLSTTPTEGKPKGGLATMLEQVRQMK